jgi:hypothetical protein
MLSTTLHHPSVIYLSYLYCKRFDILYIEAYFVIIWKKVSNNNNVDKRILFTFEWSFIITKTDRWSK